MHWARVAILDTVGCTLAGASEPCARIVARVTAAGGPCLVFGTDAARGAPGCRADQRHRVACTGLRRLQQHAGRASIGADPAGTVRAGRHARGRWPRIRRGLCGGLGDRDAHRARHQLLPLRERLASRPRRSACSAPPPRAAICWDWRPMSPQRRWAGRVVRVGRQGELRHDDQAAACRSLLAQRHAGGAAGGGGVHRQCRRAGAQAGVPACVQRRRAISMRTRSCATGVSPGTSCSLAWRSSSIHAAAARIRRSMRCCRWCASMA